MLIAIIGENCVGKTTLANKINEKCLENFTKKDVILYIRNALSHNDKENPLYWFERDNG